MASAQLGSLAGMASAQLGSLIRVQTGGHKASLWTLDSCECSMCTHVIIRPPLPILPYMLPTIRGQHHIVCQEFSCGAVGACSKYSTTPLMQHMQPISSHPPPIPSHPHKFEAYRTSTAHIWYMFCDTCCVVHAASLRYIHWALDAGRWV